MTNREKLTHDLTKFIEEMKGDEIYELISYLDERFSKDRRCPETIKFCSICQQEYGECSPEESRCDSYITNWLKK